MRPLYLPMLFVSFLLSWALLILWPIRKRAVNRIYAQRNDRRRHRFCGAASQRVCN